MDGDGDQIGLHCKCSVQKSPKQTESSKESLHVNQTWVKTQKPKRGINEAYEQQQYQYSTG